MMRLAAVISFSLWAGVVAVRDESGDDATANASVVDGAGANVSSRGCETQVICLVTANKEADHDKEYRELFEGCLRADKDTKVVALALQDFAGGVVPDHVGDKHKRLEGMPSDRFKLRHQLMLSNSVGEGHFCYGKWSGGAMTTAIAGAVIGAKVGAIVGKGIGAIPGAIIGALGGAIMGHVASTSLGASCGGVALLLYSLQKVEVTFDPKKEQFTTDAWQVKDVTATTIKGTVAGVFTINDRPIVLASTHAAEGVRAKDGSSCPLAADADQDQFEKLVQKERNRVVQFRAARDEIAALRGKAAGSGAIWGGDFNPRSADPTTGCPIWPIPGDDAASLSRLKEGQDVLGEDPDKAGVLTTFTSELEGTGLAELVGKEMVCPTYKKQEAASDDKPGFSCKEDGSVDMFYMPSHPPSWTDRLFHSADTAWLTCGPTVRVAHKSDHDAVLAACTVKSPEC